MRLFPFVATAFALIIQASAGFTRRSALTDCLYPASVPVILSSSSSWNLVTQPFNLGLLPALPPPAVVAIPRNDAEVQKALKCAAQTSTRVSVKSGGHSYAGHGLVGTMVLDMQEFQRVAVNANSKLAAVGAGVRLGNLASKIYSIDKRALPHGTCPGVGIGGHSTLGGFGLDSRLWGLTLDVIDSLRVVTANGSRVFDIDVWRSPDLFWGMRGAGASNFAVVTEFRFKTFAAPEKNVKFEYIWERFSTREQQARALEIALDYGVKKAQKEVGYGLFLGAENDMIIRGVYYAPASDANPRQTVESWIAPLLDLIRPLYGGDDAEFSIRILGWIDHLKDLADGPLETSLKSYNEHSNFYAKSLVVPQNKPFSLTALRSFVEAIQPGVWTPPSDSFWMVLVNLYGGSGSAINAVPKSATSYAHRDSGYVWQFYMETWSPNDAITDKRVLLSNLVQSLGPEAVGLPAYAPYADSDPAFSNPQERYWGSENLERLKELKKQWDPIGVLYNPQGF